MGEDWWCDEHGGPLNCGKTCLYCDNANLKAKLRLIGELPCDCGESVICPIHEVIGRETEPYMAALHTLEAENARLREAAARVVNDAAGQGVRGYRVVPDSIDALREALAAARSEKG